MKLIIEGPRRKVERIANMLRASKVSITKQYTEEDSQAAVASPVEDEVVEKKVKKTKKNKE